MILRQRRLLEDQARVIRHLTRRLAATTTAGSEVGVEILEADALAKVRNIWSERNRTEQDQTRPEQKQNRTEWNSQNRTEPNRTEQSSRTYKHHHQIKFMLVSQVK